MTSPPAPVSTARRLPAGVLPRLLPTPPATALADHLDRFGPLALPTVGDVGGLSEALAAAGLRGGGGAGFPTAVKLRAVDAAASARPGRRRRVPIVVANGTEGEPVSVKDATLLALAPHLILDGMVAAATALGANEAVLCLGRARPAVRAAVDAALVERAGADLVPIRVEQAPSRYVTGEESALVHWLNGGAAIPTATPPRPFERGVAGRPTLVDNVETLANVALIARFGPEWWAAIGEREGPGSFLATVRDEHGRASVFEVPYGLPLETLIAHAGVGSHQAVLVGGYFGTWLSPATAASVSLSPTSLAGAGAALGCGAITVLPHHVCPVAEVARVATWLAGESAGQCGPCAHGLPAIAGALRSMVDGTDDGAAHRRVRRWVPMVAGRGACRLPDGAVRFVASALDVFGDHAAEHRDGRCPLPPMHPVLPLPRHAGERR